MSCCDLALPLSDQCFRSEATRVPSIMFGSRILVASVLSNCAMFDPRCR
jgi:hypothetical protein